MELELLLVVYIIVRMEIYVEDDFNKVFIVELYLILNFSVSSLIMLFVFKGDG